MPESPPQDNNKSSHRRTARGVVPVLWLALLAAGGMGTAASAQPQPGGGQPAPAPGTVFAPPSSLPRANDTGKNVHTNLLILVPPANPPGGRAQPPGAASPAPGTEQNSAPAGTPASR